MPLFCDWRTASEPADVVRPVIAALRQGELVALPAEGGYLVVADATNPDACRRLNAANGDELTDAFLLASCVAEVELQVGPLPASVERILSRLWPGPLGCTLQSGRFRAPSHTAVESVLLEVGTPLLARETRRSALTEERAADVAGHWGDRLSLVVDAGPRPYAPVAWVQFEGASWQLLEPGLLSESEIQTAAAQWIVFVCTGNTCRSPMAEAILKAKLAARLGCEIGDLTAHGYRVLSAGVSAFPGDEPSPVAADVLREMQIDLSGHRSRALSVELAAQADHLIGMTRSHLSAVISRYPAIGGTMRLLCGLDGDLEDPIGGNQAIYAACARTIVRRVERLLQELVHR